MRVPSAVRYVMSLSESVTALPSRHFIPAPPVMAGTFRHMSSMYASHSASVGCSGSAQYRCRSHRHISPSRCSDMPAKPGQQMG